MIPKQKSYARCFNPHEQSPQDSPVSPHLFNFHDIILITIFESLIYKKQDSLEEKFLKMKGQEMIEFLEYHDSIQATIVKKFANKKKPKR